MVTVLVPSVHVDRRKSAYPGMELPGQQHPAEMQDWLVNWGSRRIVEEDERLVAQLSLF